MIICVNLERILAIREQGTVRAAGIMHQHCRGCQRKREAISGAGAYVEVVVSVAGDGEIPHPAVAARGLGASLSDGDLPARSLQRLAFAEMTRLDPLAGGRVPEQVVARGVDDLGPAVGLDLQVI